MPPSSRQLDFTARKIQTLLSSIGHEMGFPLPPSAYEVNWNHAAHEKGLFHTDGMGAYRLYINASPLIHRELGNLLMQYVPQAFEKKLSAITHAHRIPFYFEKDVPFHYGGADRLSDWEQALTLLERTLPAAKPAISRS